MLDELNLHRSKSKAQEAIDSGEAKKLFEKFDKESRHKNGLVAGGDIEKEEGVEEAQEEGEQEKEDEEEEDEEKDEEVKLAWLFPLFIA